MIAVLCSDVSYDVHVMIWCNGCDVQYVMP
jgi:hypothetical protein